jgi:hypothetical protein
MNDAPPAAPSVLPPAPAAPAWPAWQCVAFRFAACYFVLYAFPDPLSELPGLGGAGAIVGELWQSATTWCADHGLSPYPVIHQPTGSGDTGHDIEQCVLVAIGAAVLTAVWSLLQRGAAGHPRLGRWLHLAVRFTLAFTMLGYGSSKLYGSQFGEMSLDRLTQEIGDTWPMTMVGTFMKAFPPYEVFGGVGEVLGALLLFHRRTALLGAFLTIAVTAHVCALNWLCGVPVKLFSAHLLLAAVLLLAPYAGSLWALFVRNRPSTPVDLAVVRSKRAGRVLLAGGTLWVGTVLVLMHINGVAGRAPRPGQEQSALYGLWVVDSMRLDGVEVPAADATRWRFLAIDRGTLAWSRDANGQRHFFDFKWDPATDVALVKDRGATSDAASWTCAPGTTTAKVDPPLLLRREDRGKKVDGQRRTLVISGQLGQQQLELHTTEKLFRLQTGFRLRQELPDFW